MEATAKVTIELGSKGPGTDEDKRKAYEGFIDVIDAEVDKAKRQAYLTAIQVIFNEDNYQFIRARCAERDAGETPKFITFEDVMKYIQSMRMEKDENGKVIFWKNNTLRGLVFRLHNHINHLGRNNVPELETFSAFVNEAFAFNSIPLLLLWDKDFAPYGYKLEIGEGEFTWHF